MCCLLIFCEKVIIYLYNRNINFIFVQTNAQ